MSKRITFPTWKKIKIGTYRLSRQLRFAIGDHFDISAADLLQVIAIADGTIEIDLVNVSVGELGFKDGAARDGIDARAFACGLALVPAEAAPQLFLQYPDQPKGECLILAMRPGENSIGGSVVFCVENIAGTRFLSTRNGGLNVRWPAKTRFLYARKKKIAKSDKNMTGGRF